MGSGMGGGFGGASGTPRTATGMNGSGGYPMGGYANAGVDTTPVKASAGTGDYHNNTLASPADLTTGQSTQRAKWVLNFRSVCSANKQGNVCLLGIPGRP